MNTVPSLQEHHELSARLIVVAARCRLEALRGDYSIEPYWFLVKLAGACESITRLMEAELESPRDAA